MHRVQSYPVTSTPPDPTLGLRERRRRQTLRDISAATVALTSEHGFDHVTVDDISARAGISRRTFFNYFSTKEDALLYPPLELPPSAVAVFVTDTSVPVGDALVELLVAHAEQFEEHRHSFEALLAVIDTDPRLGTVLRRRFMAFEDVIATAVAQRLGVSPDEMVPQSLAAVSGTMLRLAATRTHHSGSADMIAELRRGFRTLETLVARPPG